MEQSQQLSIRDVVNIDESLGNIFTILRMNELPTELQMKLMSVIDAVESRYRSTENEREHIMSYDSIITACEQYRLDNISRKEFTRILEKIQISGHSNKLSKWRNFLFAGSLSAVSSIAISQLSVFYKAGATLMQTILAESMTLTRLGSSAYAAERESLSYALAKSKYVEMYLRYTDVKASFEEGAGEGLRNLYSTITSTVDPMRILNLTDKMSEYLNVQETVIEKTIPSVMPSFFKSALTYVVDKTVSGIEAVSSLTRGPQVTNSVNTVIAQIQNTDATISNIEHVLSILALTMLIVMLICMSIYVIERRQYGSAKNRIEGRLAEESAGRLQGSTLPALEFAFGGKRKTKTSKRKSKSKTKTSKRKSKSKTKTSKRKTNTSKRKSKTSKRKSKSKNKI